LGGYEFSRKYEFLQREAFLDENRVPERYGLEGKVLVLNQSYEPVSVCSPKKAIILLFMMKAELVAPRENYYFRSVNQTFQLPSVIKLTRYIRIPFKQVELSRKNVMRRDGLSCQYCGSRTTLTIDHIVPRSRGGADTWENLITACVACNNKKGNRTPEEAKMPLLSKPKKPSHIVYLKQYIGKFDESWKPFLFML